MTAIAGCWNYGGRPGASDACRRMLAAQRIYGPHHEANWSNGEVALGRALYRLLPEDRHDRDVQASADGLHRIVADVRLDNRSELADALGIGEAQAAAMPDAAFVLAAWRRWGEQALDRLVGDFAFALWDEPKQTLILATDFLGQRPLHYHRGDGFFAFATMPKGLHALPDVPYAPDEQAVAEFLVLMPQGDSRSFFKDISLVEPGEMVRVTPPRTIGRRYWQPQKPDPAAPLRSDHVEGLRHLLDRATADRLRGAGGRVASHLSAGFDSAAVTATAARLLAAGGRVAAFTAVPKPGYGGAVPAGRIGDEGPLAAATAALYPNVDHVLIRSGHKSPVERLDRDFFLFDRPMLNPCNMVWVNAINDEVRDRGIAVMLTGQMGNMSLTYAGSEWLGELFGSGRLFRLCRIGAALIRHGDMSWRQVLSSAMCPHLPPKLWKRLSQWRGRSYDVLHYSAIAPDRLETLDLERTARERGIDLGYRPRSDPFETRLWVLRRTVPGLYNKGTLAGWGIDQRDPTADRRLMEYCLGLPGEAFLAGGRTRALARRGLADRLPAAVLDQRMKGLQAIDWHEGATAARSEIAAEVERFAGCTVAGETLNADRLRSLLAAWPERGWDRREVSEAYRFALLRGVAGGHFLRRASGSNA